MNSVDESDNREYPFEQNNDLINLVPVQNVARKKRNIIEPALFFVSLAVGLFETALPNVIELQFCTSVLDIAQSDCTNTSYVSQTKVQTFVTTFQTIRTAVEVVIPCILTFFIGPWSDTYGRKPLLLCSLIGIFTTYSLWTWASSAPTLMPHYFIMFSIPYALTGGLTMIFLSSFCYISDVTSTENRSARFGIMQAFMFIGNLVGVITCPKLNNYGYTVTFGVAAACVYISLTYAYFFIEESVVPSEIQRNAVSKNPFQLSHVKDVWETCYLKQTPKNRLTIGLVILMVNFSLIQLFGESGVLYMFMQRILNVTLEQYTPLLAFSISACAIFSLLGTWLFSKVLKCNDLYVISVTVYLRLLSALTVAFGWELWHIYASRVLAASSGLGGPLLRSFVSKIFPPDDLGKIFSFLASAESATPLIASVLYTFVYNKTLVVFPAAIFLLSAFLMLLTLSVILILVELHIPSSISTGRITQQTPSINT